MIRWLLGTDEPQTVSVDEDQMLRAMEYTEHEQSLNDCGIVSRKITTAEEAERAAFWRRVDGKRSNVLQMKRRIK